MNLFNVQLKFRSINILNGESIYIYKTRNAHSHTYIKVTNENKRIKWNEYIGSKTSIINY